MSSEEATQEYSLDVTPDMFTPEPDTDTDQYSTPRDDSQIPETLIDNGGNLYHGLKISTKHISHSFSSDNEYEPPSKKVRVCDNGRLSDGDNGERLIVVESDSDGSSPFKSNIRFEHDISNGYESVEHDSDQEVTFNDKNTGFDDSLLDNSTGNNEGITVQDTDEDSNESESLFRLKECLKPSLTHHDSQVPGPSTKPAALHKIASVAKDADNISSLLGLDNSELVYKRLNQLRNKGNRTDHVINEILENGVESLRSIVEKSAENQEDGADILALVEDVEKIRDLLSKKAPHLTVSPDEIFCLIESNIDRTDRVEVVADQIMNIPTQLSNSNNKNTGESDGIKNKDGSQTRVNSSCADIFSDMEVVMSKLPLADPNNVYSLLEECGDANDRIQKVIETLRNKDSGATAENSDKNNSDNDELSNTPLYQELKQISAMFPKKDKNEIYAYLEAHYHSPNRIQIVTDELLKMDQGSQDSIPALDLTESGKNRPGYLIRLQNDVDTLRKVFPDCDPNYLFEQLENMSNDADRVNTLSSMMFDKRDYPKLADRLESEKCAERIRKLRNVDSINIDEFLQMFPDPATVFYDKEKEMSSAYCEHAKTRLYLDFPMLSIQYITKKLTEHKNHYLPTYRTLEKARRNYNKDPVGTARLHRRFLATPRLRTNEMPKIPDEFFYKELLFSRHEQAIKDHIQDEEDEKANRLKEACERGELHECQCCYDDEVLFEDMLACPEGHLFCRECVRRSTESNIGEAKVNFPCFEAECDKEFSMATLQGVLSAKMFSILLRRIQEEEIRKADIDDLVGCPFCSFATIMANPDDKVFKCLNPECLKESCRLCKEPSHIPLRCDEVEKESEKDMRAYIESRMTEAMIRTCWKCKNRFYKVEGCNKMTCTCGASMCYVCREPITGYDHFNRGTCNNADAQKIHGEEMKKAAEEARKQYERDHPEAKGVNLKNDPNEHLQEYEKNQASLFGRGIPHDEYYEDDEDEEEDEDEDEDEYDDSDEDIDDGYEYQLYQAALQAHKYFH